MGEGKGGVCRFYHSLDPVIMGLAVDKTIAKLRIKRIMIIAWKFYLHEVGWIKFTSLFVGDKKVSPLWPNTNCYLLVQQNLAHDFFGLSCLFWGWVWRLQRPFWWKQPQNGVGGQVIKTKTYCCFSIIRIHRSKMFRNDLKMGKGKAAAQCCHATLSAYKQARS